MGFIIEFRDEEHFSNLMDKMHKAKKAVCDAFDELKRADETRMNERDGRYYRDGYRNNSYRDGSYGDEDMWERRGRDGMGRYV